MKTIKLITLLTVCILSLRKAFNTSRVATQSVLSWKKTTTQNQLLWKTIMRNVWWFYSSRIKNPLKTMVTICFLSDFFKRVASYFLLLHFLPVGEKKNIQGEMVKSPKKGSVVSNTSLPNNWKVRGLLWLPTHLLTSRQQVEKDNEVQKDNEDKFKNCFIQKSSVNLTVNHVLP